MGTIIVGKIESGHIKKNQSVLLMPNKVTERVVIGKGIGKINRPSALV